MIKHKYKQFLLIILFFTSSLSYADISDKSINKILDLSGLIMQVNQFPGLLKVGMEQAKQQGTPISDAEYNSMVMSVDESILPSDIIHKIRVSLKNSLSEAEAKQLLVWYESELGKEITTEEKNSSTPESYQLMMQSTSSLLENPERVAFAKRLDALIGATDMAMNIQEYSSIAIYSAIMTAIQPNSPPNLEPFKAQMDAESAQTRAALEQMVILSSVYSYQNIEIEKLNKYEAFLNEPATVKFNKVTTESMNMGIELSISKLADTLALIFKNKKQQN